MSDTETTTQQRVYSDDEIRGAINNEHPLAALEITLVLFQRMTLALESIAVSMQEPPTVLFEQAPNSDGLGMLDLGRRTGDTDH